MPGCGLYGRTHVRESDGSIPLYVRSEPPRDTGPAGPPRYRAPPGPGWPPHGVDDVC